MQTHTHTLRERERERERERRAHEAKKKKKLTLVPVALIQQLLLHIAGSEEKSIDFIAIIHQHNRQHVGRLPRHLRRGGQVLEVVVAHA